jgi:transposase
MAGMPAGMPDAQWAALKAALDAVRSGTGRPFADERRTVEAVVWRLRNGARWRAVPAELGPWWRAAQLHRRWAKAGVWARLFAALRDAGRPELAELFLDGTSVRAHAKAAGAPGGPARTPSGAHAAATARRPASSPTPGAGRSPSPSSRARRAS